MKPSGSIQTILTGWGVLVASRVFAALLIPSGPEIMSGMFAWSLAPDLLVVVVLWWAGMRSGWRGMRLAIALFAISFGLHLINTVEAAILLTDPVLGSPQSVLNALLTYGAAAPVWAVLFARRSAMTESTPVPLAATSPLGWVWRVLVSVLAYVLLYLIAGMIAFPFVQDFYATQTLPPLPMLVTLQLLLRGPGFTAICILILRMLRLEGWNAALAVGAQFTILSGVAALVAPSPHFPDYVRWAHFFEVSISNFLFGATVGWIWSRRVPRIKLAAREAV